VPACDLLGLCLPAASTVHSGMRFHVLSSPITENFTGRNIFLTGVPSHWEDSTGARNHAPRSVYSHAIVCVPFLRYRSRSIMRVILSPQASKEGTLCSSLK
jgi:hypothetical protein